jgi:hypothetical protein
MKTLVVNPKSLGNLSLILPKSSSIFQGGHDSKLRLPLLQSVLFLDLEFLEDLA